MRGGNTREKQQHDPRMRGHTVRQSAPPGTERPEKDSGSLIRYWPSAEKTGESARSKSHLEWFVLECPQPRCACTREITNTHTHKTHTRRHTYIYIYILISIYICISRLVVNRLVRRFYHSGNRRNIKRLKTTTFRNMRMKASLGMDAVCEFCTMMQATSEQRLSSWHTDSNLGREAACGGQNVQGVRR